MPAWELPGVSNFVPVGGYLAAIRRDPPALLVVGASSGEVGSTEPLRNLPTTIALSGARVVVHYATDYDVFDIVH